ncbi:MAG TPA: D-alanyl-D-alanine carboxypeptidase/D-alanyl-D-alanine-endopeptidase, partial [Gammaproteobacteria bacterium]|nr:D-alanyl-D-alanine carboxypeptidase/D-alanyl-D-alanine-endopeptidase [Gammaproteobacteria bacterium]
AAQIGLWVQDADTKEILYTRNPEQGFTPASVTKSFTAAASILDLGSEFSYQTVLAYDKSQHLGTSAGDIALVFSGDPSLTREALVALLANIKRLRINTLLGNIIIDDSYFTEPYEARGIVAEDTQWYFGNPVKSIIIDENQIPITITPGARLGEKVSLSVKGPIQAPLDHDVITVTPEEAQTLCQLNMKLTPKNNGIYLYGCWPLDKPQQATMLKVALVNPQLYVEQIIREFLNQEGIHFEGKILTGQSLHTRDILARHDSAALASLNAMTMQRSNNLYADSLAKVLGKKNYQRGTLQAGSYAIVQILEKHLKIDLEKIRLVDGSGQSTYDQITPKITLDLLQAMYDRKDVRQTFFNTMEVSIPEHSFYDRLPPNLAHPLYVKTGSMTGVSNMAGYLKTKSGRTLIFVCFLNRLPIDRTQARLFEQKLLERLNDI